MVKRFLGSIDVVATLSVLTALLFWSIGPVCIKYISDSVDYWTQNALRYVIGALFWVPYLVLVIKREGVGRIVWYKAMVPAFFNVVMQIFWASSFYYLSPSLGSLLAKTSVFFVVLFSAILFIDERHLLRSWRLWLSMFLCLAGVVGIMLSGSQFATGQNVTGLLLITGCAIAWAMYAVSIRYSMVGINSKLSFSIISVYTALALSVLAILFGKPIEALYMNVSDWAAVVVSAILCISLAHVFFYVAIKRIGATISSIILLSTPFATLAIAWFWFGDRLSLGQWVFGLLLICGASLAILAQADLRKK